MKATIIMAKTIVLVFSLFLSACATRGGQVADERDPWEGFNRQVYSFNEVADNVIFDPIGQVYRTITPDFVDRSASNFFQNLAQIAIIANDFLQFKLGQAANDTIRFFINSTLGLAGIFDIASDAGLHSSNTHFGQTLAYFGVDAGPFVILPLLGPTTVRDGLGAAIDNIVLSPVSYVNNDLTRAGFLSLEFIDIKSDLGNTIDLIAEVAIDQYEFVKNAYFEKQAKSINDNAFEGFPEL